MTWNNDPIEENEGNPDAISDYLAEFRRDWNSIDWQPIRLVSYVAAASLVIGFVGFALSALGR